VYLDSRVLTDIRPIFSLKEDLHPTAAVIIHNLEFVTHTDDRHTYTYIALDPNDLRKLKRTLERALQKEEILKKSVVASGMTYLDSEAKL
jgi:hypothetical protein